MLHATPRNQRRLQRRAHSRRYVRISPGRYLRQQRAYGIFCALNGGTGSLPFELFGHWWHSTADGMPRWERSGDAPLMCAAMG